MFTLTLVGMQNVMTVHLHDEPLTHAAQVTMIVTRMLGFEAMDGNLGSVLSHVFKCS